MPQYINENILAANSGHLSNFKTWGGGMSEMDKGDWEIETATYKISHGNDKYSIGNTVNKTVQILVTDDDYTEQDRHWEIYRIMNQYVGHRKLP